MRLDHKLEKRNSFVCCSPYIPESLYNGFSKFLINPRDWAQVSQGRAVCAWCCVYSGLPEMLFFEGFSLSKGLLSILDSQSPREFVLDSSPLFIPVPWDPADPVLGAHVPLSVDLSLGHSAPLGQKGDQLGHKPLTKVPNPSQNESSPSVQHNIIVGK